MSKKIIKWPISSDCGFGSIYHRDSEGKLLTSSEVAETANAMHKKLSDAIAVLGRCNDAWQGGVEDHGLMDDISTLRNQIRKLIEPIGKAETIDLDALLEEGFNKLRAHQKWDQWKKQKKFGYFKCPNCDNRSEPERCSPFHGSTMHCGNCEHELSRRTGGGQNDPFGWVFVAKVSEKKK